MTDTAHKQSRAQSYLQRYNQCFYDKNLDALRRLYSDDAGLLFWDNHAGCDSTTLADHLHKLSAFFEHGKTTESGAVEPLLIQDHKVHITQDIALVTARLLYASAPRPAVRSSFVLTWSSGDWRALHVHHSFDPNEAP